MKIRSIGLRLGIVSVNIEYSKSEDYINDGEIAKEVIKQILDDHFQNYLNQREERVT